MVAMLGSDLLDWGPFGRWFLGGGFRGLFHARLGLLFREGVSQAPASALLLEGANLFQGDVLQAAVDVIPLRIPEGV
jgi:hypothetical protein